MTQRLNADAHELGQPVGGQLMHSPGIPQPE
jgi:hypothetical protein